jgi:hypothetical protein
MKRLIKKSLLDDDIEPDFNFDPENLDFKEYLINLDGIIEDERDSAITYIDGEFFEGNSHGYGINQYFDNNKSFLENYQELENNHEIAYLNKFTHNNKIYIVIDSNTFDMNLNKLLKEIKKEYTNIEEIYQANSSRTNFKKL